MRAVKLISAIAPITALLGAAAHAEEGEIDTDHLFAFSQGTDIGPPGTTEFETGATGRFGKRDGSYTAYEQEFEFGYIPVDNLHLFAGVSANRFDISNVPDLENRKRTSFGELSFHARYRLIDRGRGPFGLALQLEGGWAAADELSGEKASSYGGVISVLADKVIVEDVLVSVVNVSYGRESTRVPDETEKGSSLEISGAVLARLAPNFFLGVGAQHVWQYEGLGLDRFAGQATFLGPNLCWKPGRVWIIAGWSPQIAGHARGTSGSLDLVNFERNIATLSIGFGF